MPVRRGRRCASLRAVLDNCHRRTKQRCNSESGRQSDEVRPKRGTYEGLVPQDTDGSWVSGHALEKVRHRQLARQDAVSAQKARGEYW
jgi:hypothetical protein